MTFFDRPGPQAWKRQRLVELGCGLPPFLRFAPADLVAMAREAGFKDARHVSAEVMIERYFKGRPDGLRPSNGEEMLVAST